jgi:hypothetical protein
MLTGKKRGFYSIKGFLGVKCFMSIDMAYLVGIGVHNFTPD